MGKRVEYRYMIETADLPNWQRWGAKEDSGINRGYTQAYRNTSRADHFVLLTLRNSDYDDEVTVTVKPYDNGDWKPDWSAEDEQTFTGQDSDREEILTDAEQYACEWMSNHPCTRGEGNRDDIEFLTDLFAALEDEGLVMQHDASVDGWKSPDHMDSTSHNIRPLVHDESDNALRGADDPREADALDISIRLDGKLSGLSYREYTEHDSDGESRRMHEPRDPDALHDSIEQAARTLGFEDLTVRNSGHQKHWDHAISYNIVTFLPDEFDLTLPAPDSTPTQSRPSLF